LPLLKWVLKDGRRQAWRLTLPRPRSKVGDGRQFTRSAVTLEGKPIRFRPTPDEHIRIGGPFFDVLRGEYVIEPPPNGKTRLHLLSQHRVSTDLNWYARFWTDGVMSGVQETILTVIQKRCEAQAHEGT